MDSIHDLGGMDGFDPVQYDGPKTARKATEEDTFTEKWEGNVYAMNIAILGNEITTIDEFRYSIEQIPPEDYLGSSYYDRWVTAMARLLIDHGVIDADNYATLTSAFASGEATVPEHEDPGLLGKLVAGLDNPVPAKQDPAFSEGETVIVRSDHPSGHTRCPRYVRRAKGEVTAVHGTEPIPDARAHGRKASEPLYQVVFDGQELWGEEADPALDVTLDLWESYLKPTETGSRPIRRLNA